MPVHIRASLAAVFIAALFGIGFAVGTGDDVPSLRTEYSRTVIQADGQYTTQIFTVPIHRRGPDGQWLPVDVDSVKRCYPQTIPDWTGNVKWQNSNYTKISGDMYFRGGSNASRDKRQAWAKFDLSPIPNDAELTMVYFWYYCYDNSGVPSTYVRLLTIDPVTAGAAALWSAITTGPDLTGYYGHGQGWQCRNLNSTGLAAVQSRLLTDWIALGLHEWEDNNDIWGVAYGFAGGPGQSYTPYLSVSYSPPPVTDISAEDVVSPAGVMKPGTIIPIARWRNRQPHTDNFLAYFFLESPVGTRIYRESIPVASLAGLHDTALVFPSYTIIDTGTWTARCSTYAFQDIDTLNNARTEQFDVRVHVPGLDVGAFEILAPIMWLDTQTTVEPRARWRNYTGTATDFVAYLILENTSKARLFSRVISVSGLSPWRDTIITFPEFNVGTDTGRWAVICSTSSSRDTNAANDMLSGFFTVQASKPQWKVGWEEFTPVPSMPSGRDVKDGGWLTFDPATGLVYCAKGNNTGDFYCYDPAGDTWTQLARWREGLEAKMSKKGGVGAADGWGHVYAVKGSSTSGFWRYDIAGDSWTQLPGVPLGGDNKKIKGGSDLVCVDLGGTTYAYLLKGYKNQFYRYNTATDSWEILKEAPTGSSQKWDKGSWLAYDDETQAIYAHKAKWHELWRFDVLTGEWGTTQLGGMPFANRRGGSKKSKDGGAGAWFNNSIYALKGGNTCEFWRYYVEGDSWAELDTLPQIGSAGKKKRVKGGGDLVAIGSGRFLATKGSKTREFWHFYQVQPRPPQGGGLDRTVGAPKSVHLDIRPSLSRGTATVLYSAPGSATARIQVLDAAGRVVYDRMASPRHGAVRLSGLASGVYLVRFAAGDLVSTGKLIVEH